MKLEDLKPNASVRGLLPSADVTVVSIEWYGSEALSLVYRTQEGKVNEVILYRYDEQELSLSNVAVPGL